MIILFDCSFYDDDLIFLEVTVYWVFIVVLCMAVKNGYFNNTNKSFYTMNIGNSNNVD